MTVKTHLFLGSQEIGTAELPAAPRHGDHLRVGAVIGQVAAVAWVPNGPGGAYELNLALIREPVPPAIARAGLVTEADTIHPHEKTDGRRTRWQRST